MSRAAEDVIHMKTILADELTQPLFREMMGHWMESEATDGPLPWSATFKHGDSADAECDYMRNVLLQSENFYVAKPMIRLAQAVSPDMPDEELRPHDLPANSGFMWLAEPYSQIDIRRKVLSVDCFLWHGSGGKVRLWHLTHKANEVDWVNQWLRSRYDPEFVQQMPMLSVNHVFEMRFNEILPRGISWETPLPWDATVEYVSKEDPETGRYSIEFYTDKETAGLSAGEGPRVMRSPLAAFLVCLWRLCQQSIASRIEEEPSRPARRRQLRGGVPARPISVINLRRFDQTAAHPEAGGIEWQHHWVVRGHWRKQPYREKNEQGEKTTIYRHIYINPFLKGDLTKPLLHRDKVNALIR